MLSSGSCIACLLVASVVGVVLLLTTSQAHRVGLSCNRAAVFQEVEKEVVENVPGKKPRKRTLRQMEYCYEAELEGACLLQIAVLSDCSQQGLLSLNLQQNAPCICCAGQVCSAADTGGCQVVTYSRYGVLHLLC